jgi:hypothetical protein
MAAHAERAFAIDKQKFVQSIANGHAWALTCMFATQSGLGSVG